MPLATAGRPSQKWRHLVFTEQEEEGEEEEGDTPEGANCQHGGVPSPSEAPDIAHNSVARKPNQGQKMRTEEEKEEEEDNDTPQAESMNHCHSGDPPPSEVLDLVHLAIDGSLTWGQRLRTEEEDEEEEDEDEDEDEEVVLTLTTTHLRA